MASSDISNWTPDPNFPWADRLDKLLGHRCRAVREPRGPFSYYGRCEFKEHSVDMDHCLEREMINVRWSTRDLSRGHG